MLFSLELEPRKIKTLPRRAKTTLRLLDVWQALCYLRTTVQVECTNLEIVKEPAKVTNNDYQVIGTSRSSFCLVKDRC